MAVGLSMQHWDVGRTKFAQNDDSGLTLTYSTTRSNLIPIAFIWENLKKFTVTVKAKITILARNV